MVESALLEVTYLLFFGIIGMFIINVVLVSIILVLLHRQ